MNYRSIWQAAALPLACALTVAALPAPADAQQAQPAQQAQSPIHEFTHVAGAVWRFRNNAHYGLVMVTPAGAVVVDPLTAETARWLKDELARRFNGLKVVDVVYSHHDWDHATGAAEFGKVPIISRVETLKTLEPPTDPAARESFTQQFSGVVPPTENYTGAVKRITVGGHTLEMHAVKSRHAADLSYIWFPAEKILLTVDIVSPHFVPFRNLPGYEPADFEGALERALAFHPTYLVGGHGEVGSVKSVADLRKYLADLRAGVAAGIANGQSLEQIQKELTLDQYKDWGDYKAYREMNIEGMYKLLKAGQG